MKTIILSILFLSVTSAFAQETATWKGGTPGRETSWDEPRNWSSYQVPDEFTHVVIKALHTGHHTQPIINHKVEVASLQIHVGATLTVKKGGSVSVDGHYQQADEMTLYGGLVLMEVPSPTVPKLINSDLFAPKMAKQ